MAMRCVSKRNDSGLAWLAAIGMSIAAGVLRLLPHWPNFTPVGALGLFAGARLRFWQACTVPLVVMAVSDLLLWGAFGWRPFDPFVYLSLLVSVALGRLFLKTGGLWRVPVVSVIASLQFFVVTNFGVWAGGDGSLYPKTLAGLARVTSRPCPSRATAAGHAFSSGLWRATSRIRYSSSACTH